jgi:hypothetical protein
MCASNLSGALLEVSLAGLCTRRMWLEEMFADFKGHSFDLESNHPPWSR